MPFIRLGLNAAIDQRETQLPERTRVEHFSGGGLREEEDLAKFQLAWRISESIRRSSATWEAAC
jgi:hypothetical protein